jgi:dihydroorotase
VIDLAIAGGRVIDPARSLDVVGDLLIEAGRVVGVAKPGTGPHARSVVDATGLWVTPGLIDMHVHLREPGGEHKETIATGVAAAVAGGFTTIAAMANTSPVNDSVEVTRWLCTRSEEIGLAHVLPVAAVTRGLAGAELTDFTALCEAGAVAFSDDGMPVADDALMARALREGRRVGAPVISHAEDRALAAGGVMHAGVVAARLGLPGIPPEAEERMVARDCRLAAETGARLHVAHISTAGAVEVIRRARVTAKTVSAEATPHHFTLDHEAVERQGPLAKMNPPLRTAADVAAVRAGLADGTIQVVASDHAPHHADEKARGMIEAPFGIVGLETTVGLTLALVHAGVLSTMAAVYALTLAPARVLGIHAGRLARGALADVSLLDPEARWTVEPSAFHSLGRNTPFGGMPLRGRAIAVVLAGRLLGNLEGRLRQ